MADFLFYEKKRRKKELFFFVAEETLVGGLAGVWARLHWIQVNFGLWWFFLADEKCWFYAIGVIQLNTLMVHSTWHCWYRSVDQYFLKDGFDCATNFMMIMTSLCSVCVHFHTTSKLWSVERNIYVCACPLLSSCQ